MIKQLALSEFPLAANVIRDSFATVAEEFDFTEQNFPKYVGFVTNVERLQNHANWGWLMYGYYDGGRLVGYASISKVYDADAGQSNANPQNANPQNANPQNAGAGAGAGAGDAYELHNLSVLPDCRHRGYGKQLLDFCKDKVKELGGVKIKIGIIEENIKLKNWYAANGFIHTGTKKFEHMPITVGYMEWPAADTPAADTPAVDTPAADAQAGAVPAKTAGDINCNADTEKTADNINGGAAMRWDARQYQKTCGCVTEHGAKLVDVLKKLPCGSVLDLGCGTGVLTNDIASFAHEVIGVDLSPAMIEKAKSSYPDIEFHVMDACSLIWEERFDAVFSNAVFHFIKPQDALLGNVRRALKYGGALVCEFGASGNIKDLLDAVEAACVKRGKDYSLRFYYPAKDEYEKLLIKHGFAADSIAVYELDTTLKDGAAGLRNWISQIFCVEMDWFGAAEREAALVEIESALKPERWDGANWHLSNRRIQVVAHKKSCEI